MTISEGYPDWQRVETRAEKPLITQTVDTLGLVVNLGPFYVGNFPLMMVRLVATGTTNYNVLFSWNSDQLGSVTIFSKLVAVSGDVSIYSAPLRVLSPWLVVTITPAAYVAGDTIEVDLVPSFNPMSQSEMNAPYQIMQSAQNIGAGATVDVNFNSVVEGPAVFWWNTSSAAWSFTIQMLDNGFAWHAVYVVNNVAAGVIGFVNIGLGPRPMRLQVHNSDAAAKVWSASIASIVY